MAPSFKREGTSYNKTAPADHEQGCAGTGELQADGQRDTAEGGGAGEGGTSQSRLLAGETEAGSGRVPGSDKPGSAPWTGRYRCLLPLPFR